jgi:hypothetical protein
MRICGPSHKCLAVMAMTSVVLLTASASAQDPLPPPSNSLEREVREVRTENAAIREQLRVMKEDQKLLLGLIQELRQRLDGSVAGTTRESLSTGEENPGTTGPAADEANVSGHSASAATNKNADETQALQLSEPVATKGNLADLYTQDGMVIAKTSDDAKVPFLLNFNVNTQIRYLNTTSTPTSFTDHLGVVHEVNPRNDITVNRAMFILGGYIFDKRLRYSFTVWTSAGSASIVVASNIGWQFNKGFTLTGGYTGVPGSRSLVNTFPYFTASDRSMADNFFRPGFTQGVWATGEPLKNLNYMAFIGNGLNTLNISANKIDANLLFSGSVWWEPLGAYGEPGKSRNMYDDYFASRKTRIRIGSAYTRSRENRFSNLNQASPENTSLYNSDGVLTFSTGAFAPGVTLNNATYQMWAIDGGLKWNGLALNGQFFLRRLDDFEADGPLPLTHTIDKGFEFSSSYFVIPKKLAVYGRGSMVFGQFGNSWEYGGGAKWNFLRTERLWLQPELIRVNKAPYTGTFTPYVSGLTGWVPMVQAIIAF